MSPRQRTFSFRRYKPIPTTGSELNRKFDSDIRRSMDLLERQKRTQPQQQQPGSSPVDAEEHLPQSGVPTLITTSRDTSSQQNLLRTKSTHSNATTTQKMYIASQQNGIVVTSTRRIESYTIQKQRSTADTTVADESTLPTFMSVGASILHTDMSRSPSFLVSASERSRSEGDNILSSSPLLRLDAVKIKPERGASVPVLGNSNRETRKKLHYKEKLRALTDRLTTSSAVERSKTMLSSMAIGQSAVLQMNEFDEDGHEEKAEKGDTPASVLCVDTTA